MKIAFLILASLFIYVPHVTAQSEIERGINSLEGIRSFFITVNVEGNDSLARKNIFNVPDLTNRFTDYLTQQGIHILKQSDNPSVTDAPYLYVHINMMDAGRGLVPFSVELRFYQPVELTLNRHRQTLASTWNENMVGIVSYDRLPVIRESAEKLLDQFTQDYHKANH